MEDQPAFPSSFGELLRTSRKRKRLTQQQQAQLLGVHPNTISAWELGSYLPATRGLVLELAHHLSLDVLSTRQLLEASLTAPLPQWLVPFPRNPFFTGREHVLEVLHARLGIHQVVVLTQSAALHGLGGVGKTQIALEYAYRYALEYRAIFWIEAETSERVVSSLVHIAEVLQLGGPQEKDHQRLVAVQRWLSTHKDWLLIWDNVEDLELLQHFLPPARQGAVLITTRCQTLGTLAAGMELEPMGRRDGVLFLLRRAKWLEPEASDEQVQQFAVRMPEQYRAAEELVRALGGLPLALDQAGAYLEETGCDLSGYLQRYEQQRHQLLDRRGALALDHPQSVAATLWLACQRVAERNRAALELLCFCAVVSADGISEELMVRGASHLGPVLGPVAADLSQFDQAIAVLRSFSLVQRHAQTQMLSLHGLVQAVLQDAMTQAERELWEGRVIRALEAVFPDVHMDTDSATWKQCERLLPHTLSALHRAEAAEESLVLASLAYKAAQYLRERGRYAEAKPLALRALHIREQILGPEHPDVGTSLNYLAVLYWRQGQYAEAQPLLERALHIREQALGPEHPDVARALNNPALIYRELGQYAKAEPLFQRVLHIWEQTLESEHVSVARALHNLAQLYQFQGKYEQAQPLRERALEIRKHVLGPDHPEVAYGLEGLATLYIEQGNYEEAQALLQRTLQLREQAFGSDHPLMTYPLNHLALTYLKQRKYEQAEDFFQRGLRIWEQGEQPEHPEVTYALNGLAELYEVQGKFEQAAQFYQRALRISERSRGPRHPDVAHALNGLANLCREQGKYAQAEAFFQRALAIREEALGQDHPKTAQTLHDLAIFQQKQGQLSEAIDLAHRALFIRLQALGGVHPDTLATQRLFAQLQQKQTCPQAEADVVARSD